MNHLQLPVVITPSRAENGGSCYRKHFLADVLSKTLYPSPSLEFGSMIHAGVGAHWLGKSWRPVIESEWNTRFNMTSVSQDNVSLPIANAMMEHYESNAVLAGPFQDAADDWRLVDVEQRFEMKLEGHKLSFQMDRVVHSPSQDWLVIGDLKTAARLDKRWERQWENSLQMKLYRLGLQTVFGHYGKLDVFIEGLHKHVPSDIRYYACPEWSSKQLGEAAFNALHIANMDHGLIEGSMLPDGSLSLEAAEELGVRYTPVNYGNCFSYNSTCPFHQICTADVDERVAILRGEYSEKTEEDY